MSEFHNRTRQSVSIPHKLLREGKFYLLPIYYLLLTSELAREGIENSGSYRFADHIYANKPQGRLVIGRLIDALLLRLPSSRSLRARYLHAKDELREFIRARRGSAIAILSVPSGLARELFEVAADPALVSGETATKVHWHGLDLDAGLIDRLGHRAQALGYPMQFRAGNALEETAFGPDQSYDMIISTGFTEFLNDEETVHFYSIVYRKLKPSGWFYTSGMLPHRFSVYLMEHIAELHAAYRSEQHLRELMQAAGFRAVRSYRDALQTLLIGIKE